MQCGWREETCRLFPGNIRHAFVGRPFVLSVLIYFPYSPCSKLCGLCFRGSGVGVLRPTTMAALLDDAEAVKLLAKAGLGWNCPNAL